MAVGAVAAAGALSPAVANAATASPVVVAAPATPAAPAADRVEKLSYNDALYLVSDTSTTPHRLTFAEWRDLGYPQFTVVPAISGTRYVQQKGLIDVYAVVDTDVYKLTFERWVAAGAPAPQVSQADAVKYPYFDSIFAVTKLSADPKQWVWHHLTLDEWVGQGMPKAETVPWVQGALYYQMRDREGKLTDDIYAYLHGEYHKLTFQEWAAVGYPTPQPGMPSV
ncbi:hypothetical protein JT358_04145 [Micrococcales bacterium 31B]|nr:hypothetical protein [Micrococcales bacterium 31B]